MECRAGGVHLVQEPQPALAMAEGINLWGGRVFLCRSLASKARFSSRDSPAIVRFDWSITAHSSREF